MPTRRFFLTASALLLFLAPVRAGEIAPFSQQSFEAAQAAGRPILIEITAPWCPTCKVQAPIIEELASRDSLKDLLVLRVDFDTQTDTVRSLGANSQSTLIVFRGRNEVSRSIGETDPKAIEAQISMAVAG
ncbi:MAG: thioredoxin family protein [Alphaproteobacteria bacterium]|nr:thioredoxin family protein [Alphaproteobacteria bacterium]